MSFKEFDRSRRKGHKPTLSIRGNAQIGLNYGAIKRYKLDEYRFVKLYYDEDEQRIGLKPFNDEEDKNGFKIAVRSDNVTIGAKSFLDEFAIQYGGKSRKYDIEWDEDTEMMVVELSKRRS